MFFAPKSLTRFQFFKSLLHPLLNVFWAKTSLTYHLLQVSGLAFKVPLTSSWIFATSQLKKDSVYRRSIPHLAAGKLRSSHFPSHKVTLKSLSQMKGTKYTAHSPWNRESRAPGNRPMFPKMGLRELSTAGQLTLFSTWTQRLLLSPLLKELVSRDRDRNFS